MCGTYHAVRQTKSSAPCYPDGICPDVLMQTFGIKGELMGLLPGRQTFVIDRNGKCIMSFNDMMNAEAHVEQALRALQSANVTA